MTYRIKVRGWASDAPCPHVGQYVLSFDFDAHGGIGFGVFTPDRASAMTFASFADAMTFWKTTSKARPIRWDGRPNRPLTAATVEIEDDDAQSR